MNTLTDTRCKRTTLAAAVALALGLGGTAQAAPIETGNPDLEVRWDNTVRYNMGMRMEGINPAFYGVAGYDETEGRFKKNRLVTNRLDLLSEVDVIYKGKFGVRVSGAAWADGAYGEHSVRNPALPVSGAYVNDTFNSYAKRYAVGPSGEILDAFAFGTFDLDGISLSLKAGQHNVYWGESLYSATNSIAYSQSAIDTLKSATSPGSEAKELFLPRKQISGSVQLNDQFSAGFQYALSWKPFRLVPGGTYFSGSDGTRSDYASTSPGFNLANGPDLIPDSGRGDLGAMLRWSPPWLGGTVALVYRKFDEKLPWSFTQLQRGASIVPTAVRLNFARDTELYGISLIQTIRTVSVGAEISYRKNTALNSVAGFTVLPADNLSATYAEAEGARGNTLHALINGVYLLPDTGLWMGGTLQGEINYSRLQSVTSNAGRFFAEGYACPAGRDRTDGCSTRSALGMNLAFNPQWPQALAGWDITAPVTMAYQLKGNGPALGGGNEDTMAWSVGLVGLRYSRYEFSMKYADTKIRYKTNPATGLVSTANGSNAVQNNHGTLFLTFKTTF
jgi:hypothetical protein